MKALVLDAWPLLAFYLEEPKAQSIERILIDSQHNGTELLISVVNTGEIWYAVCRAHGSHEADRIIHTIQELNIAIKPVDWNLTRMAAAFKASGGLSYADCFAAALARREQAALVTGDPEFRRLEGEIEINWI
ncbi:MAG: type II toxin-antitoxin system VapC family toxin [Balneolaceae bacterium]|nr:type II toxin-antitoxin system VapC family toxin [Balneolaceae bacterium]